MWGRQMLSADMVGLLYIGTLTDPDMQGYILYTGPDGDSLSNPYRQTSLDFPWQIVNGNPKDSDIFFMC